jgi:hypothetical protein
MKDVDAWRDAYISRPEFCCSIVGLRFQYFLGVLGVVLSGEFAAGCSKLTLAGKCCASVDGRA